MTNQQMIRFSLINLIIWPRPANTYMWITLFIPRVTLWHGIHSELGVLSFIIWIMKQQMIPVSLLILHDKTGNEHCFVVRMTKRETFLLLWFEWRNKNHSCFVIRMTKYKTFYVLLFEWQNTNNKIGTNFCLPIYFAPNRPTSCDDNVWLLL